MWTRQNKTAQQVTGMGCPCENLGHVGSHWVKTMQPWWLQLFVGTGSYPCWQPDTHLLLQQPCRMAWGRSRQEQLCVMSDKVPKQSQLLPYPCVLPSFSWAARPRMVPCTLRCLLTKVGWKETPTARGTESKHTEALHPGYRKTKRDLCSEYTLVSQRKAISNQASAHCGGVGQETQAKLCE